MGHPQEVSPHVRGAPAAPRAVGKGRATKRCEVSPTGGTERSEVCEDAMWDDFNRADPQGRELLLKLWGTPRR